MTEQSAHPGPILFYDGACGLCDRSVRWILRHDRRQVLRFAPLQGSTYAAAAIPGKPGALETMVLLDDKGVHTRGDAVIRVLRHIGGIWRLVGATCGMVPRPLREWAYRFIAARRMSWFGGPEACRLPTQSERARLLP